MKKIDRSLKDVDAIFVTHETAAIIRMVLVSWHVAMGWMFMPMSNLQAMANKVGKIPLAQKHIIAPNMLRTWETWILKVFAVSHDAATVHHNNKTFCIITDTGYVSDRVEGPIRNISVS
ncbi:hypothetical protein ACW18Q_07425 [Limosilactobacillus reuteri]